MSKKPSVAVIRSYAVALVAICQAAPGTLIDRLTLAEHSGHDVARNVWPAIVKAAGEHEPSLIVAPDGDAVSYGQPRDDAFATAPERDEVDLGDGFAVDDEVASSQGGRSTAGQEVFTLRPEGEAAAPDSANDAAAVSDGAAAPASAPGARVLKPELEKSRNRERVLLAHIREVGAGRHTAEQLARLAARLGKLQQRTESWHFGTDGVARPGDSEPGQVDAAAAARFYLGHAIDALSAAVVNFNNAPAGWRPTAPRVANEKAEITVGAVVAVRPKARADFADDLSAEEMNALTVKSVGKLVSCVTPGGVRVFLPRGALVVMEAGPDSDDASDI